MTELFYLKPCCTTLVYYMYNTDPPYAFGNCCSIKTKTGISYHCSNMNEENMEVFNILFPHITEVKCEILSDKACKIVDELVPMNWLNHHCNVCHR